MRDIRFPTLSSRWSRYIGLGALVALIVLLGILSVFYASRLEGNMRIIETNYRARLNEVDNVLSEFVEVKALFTASVLDKQADPTPIIKKANTLIKISEESLSAMTREDDKQLMEKLIRKLKEYKTAIIAYSDELLARRTGGDVRSWEMGLLGIEGDIHKTGAQLKNRFGEEISQIEKKILRQSGTAKKLGIVFIILGVLAGAAAVSLLQRTLARSVQELVVVSRAVAEGDLRQKASVSQNDEIGVLSQGVTTMVENLQRLVRGIKTASAGIATSAERLNHYSDDVSKGTSLQSREIDNVSASVAEMDTIINEISTKVTSLSSSLEESSASSNEMTASIKEISASADKMFREVDHITSSLLEINTSMGQTLDFLNLLSSSSQQAATGAKELTASVTETGNRARESKNLAKEVAAKSSEQGAAALAKMIEVSHKNKEMVDNYSRTIQLLGERSASIGQILDVIREVADQTNLLSINAAIIAAQTGEHGRSFAVVADEIRKLSTTTTLNVKQIEEVIQGVQKEVDDAVKLVREITAGMDSGIASAAQASRVLKEIEEISARSTKMASESADSVANQTAYCKEIYESVTDNTRQVLRIKEAMDEQKKGSDSIVSSAEEIRFIAEKLRFGTQEQSTGSSIISKTVSETHAFSEKILHAMQSEQEASRNIVKSLERISRVAETNLKAMKELDNMVKELVSLAEKLGGEMSRFKLPESSG